MMKLAGDVSLTVTTFLATFYVQWLYPETFASLAWNSLVAYGGTRYHVAWCSLFAVGSFVMATPILLAGRLRHAGDQIRLPHSSAHGSRQPH